MEPRLSIVVPIFNVECYLEECLDSLAGQSVSDIDVVMVDDGSTDGSPAIARRFAAADGRFRLVSQANAGLGAARNAGVWAADPRSGHLAFVDSDDVVPPGAYERMLDALEETGSDIATGNVLRLRENGRLEQSPMFRRPMAATRLATHVTADRELLGDRIACNKVFRRSFWDAHGFAFPEGVLYEDIPVVLPAHHLACAVDVLHDPVYHWRDRDGSITTRRAVPRGVRDRTANVRAVGEFLERHYGARAPEHKRAFDRAVLTGDLWLFMEALPDGDAEYRQAFLECANAYADTVDSAVLRDLPLLLRVKWYLIRRHRLADLLALLAYESGEGSAFLVRGTRRRYARLPALPEGAVPKPLLELRREELPLVTRLQEAVWRDGKLHVKGFAYIRNLPADTARRAVKTAWLRVGRRRVVPLRLDPCEAPEATYQSGQDLHRYDRAGFRLVIDPRRLAAQGASATWQLEVAVLHGGVVRRGTLKAAEGVTAPAVHHMDAHTRVVPTLHGKRLRLRTERVRCRLEQHDEGGDGTVRLSVAAHPSLAGRGQAEAQEQPQEPEHAQPHQPRLRLTHWHTGAEVDVPLEREQPPQEGADHRFTTQLPLHDLASHRVQNPSETDTPDTPHRPDHWGVRLLLPDGTGHAVAARTETRPGRYPMDRGEDGTARELLVGVNAHGNLVLCDQGVHPLADRVRWEEGGELVLEGGYPAHRAGCPPGEVELVLQHSGNRSERLVPVEMLEGRFRVALRPEAVAGGGGGPLPLGEGNWYLSFRRRGCADARQDAPVRILASQHHRLPLSRTVGGRRVGLERRFHDRLLIASGSALPVSERGGHRQRRLREHYAAQREEPLRDAVLYSSFDGRQFSDSPRAVHAELASRPTGLAHLWCAADQQAGIPDGVPSVAKGGAAWYEALARCRYVVTNTQLPEWFVRREGQFVVQTWHGTPLKRIGADLEGTAYGNSGYIASLAQRAGQWSLLVSPNRFSTPILTRALGYEGEVLECGYPRNDLLHAAGREQAAAEVRRDLGLPDGKRIVLYAPTWREDRPLGGGRYALDLPLDLEEAERRLGGECVLLVRKHYLVGDRVPGTGTGLVRDVSGYPDVSALLLVSDVLVTDYSSLMFDFAQTGRPMLFYTYDLDRYRDMLRGFYFDFEDQAPGPLLRTGEELIEALRDPVGATAQHHAAYEDFRRRFCDLDDGRAAARVADRMLAARTPTVTREAAQV
ncbi:CDP-glycerol glycerophosphotransferase family protein [Streptomyces sp. ODS28]|uniref:bifunctional glycosyltransferase/CDP-glycerol:glycerophosphate glycerophosphotransferase n=1 Tax=Streptomyces sp. ODS28 TaxID=3136688 RepID=UPI0031EB19C8